MLLIIPLERILFVFSADLKISSWCNFVVYKHFIIRSVLPKPMVQVIVFLFFLKDKIHERLSPREALKKLKKSREKI